MGERIERPETGGHHDVHPCPGRNLLEAWDVPAESDHREIDHGVDAQRPELVELPDGVRYARVVIAPGGGVIVPDVQVHDAHMLMSVRPRSEAGMAPRAVSTFSASVTVVGTAEEPSAYSSTDGSFRICMRHMASKSPVKLALRKKLP